MPINLELPNPQKARRFLNLNSEVWILVLVLDQSAFSAAKSARLARNYFVQLV
jgi:hypothetical protein